ncbi:TetR/AcrR family transcriptional regulator [Nonomuraea rubra]|uniref:TetR/AcrR family transcriptional regulator n=1 Tax=Nonomuraea rubra TaxID=46180 RepID=UPI0036060A29
MERLSRQEQRERNRLALLEAAEKVFAERGIQGASVDEVAAEAGLTKGAVYSNFDGKEDLLLAVLRHGLGREARAQAERLLHGGREAGALVEEFGAYWVEGARGGGQDSFARLTVEFMVHATRHPAVREQLVAVLFPDEGTGSGRHPLAPEGSGLAELPYGEADAILKSLDLGMRLLTLLAPERCPRSSSSKRSASCPRRRRPGRVAGWRVRRRARRRVARLAGQRARRRAGRLTRRGWADGWPGRTGRCAYSHGRPACSCCDRTAVRLPLRQPSRHVFPDTAEIVGGRP